MRNKLIYSEFNRLLINDMLIYLIPIVGITLYNFSDSKVVFLTSTYSIGFIIFSKVSGHIIDKFKSIRVPIWFYFTFIIINLIFAFIIIEKFNNFTTLFIIIVLMSLVSTVLEINTSVFIPDYFSQNLTSINSLVQLMRSIVNFVSPIFSFIFTHNIILALLVMIILQFLNFIIYLNINRKINGSFSKNKEKNPDENKSANRNSLLFLINNKQLLLIVIITMGINFSMTILTNTIVLYMMRYLNLQNYIAGGIISILSFGAIIGSILPKTIIKKIGFQKSIGLMNLLLSIPFILLISKSYLFFIGVFLGYLSRSFGSVLRTTLQYKIVPENVRGHINSTIYLFTWGTIPIAGYTASLLLKLLSLHEIYILISLIFIISNSLFMINFRSEKLSH
ncbi:MFS transporter [Staphylococcus epidermidis]|uniref:MFS transporter n=2 Tax=Staphylococcus epidermidis TaxID=1282 RepID=UPI0004942E24|nr:MFS transporter [Staphylococcus epidermidis]MDU6061652.1 MFS transporter [Veillonella sp.]MBM5970637.1 MFS transporter [Staphylococcus epidermidis]MBM6078106.1 MFS transporter [Staphylococcus epidermidis]MBM6082664.1 MFS transporter [Staphylococcus epidermidis]MCA0115690.1 MFS transporter [Staphylococcus epidermidis]